MALPFPKGIGYRVIDGRPQPMILLPGCELPEAEVIDRADAMAGDACDLCKRSEPCDCGPDDDCACSCGRCAAPHLPTLVRYPSDPLLFFATLGVEDGHIGRG